MPSVEERLAALERRLTAQSEDTTPTYLSIDPVTGIVTATFSGSVVLTEALTSPLAPAHAVTWQDDTGATREFMQGFPTIVINQPNFHNLVVTAQGGPNDFARIGFISQEPGVGHQVDSAQLVLNCTDSSGAAAVFTLLTSQGFSSFAANRLGAALGLILGADSGWIGLPYVAPWGDTAGQGWQAGQYRRDQFGMVHVRGANINTSGTGYAFPATNLTIATLPLGFRPKGVIAGLAFQKDTANNMAIMPCHIDTGGNIGLTMGASDDIGTNNGVPAYVLLVIPPFDALV